MTTFSGCNGLDISYSQGGGNGKSSASMSYKGFGSVEQTFSGNPLEGTMDNHVRRIGSASLSRSIFGSKGGWAKAGFDVVDYDGDAITDYEFHSSSSPYAHVGESISSQKANQIYAYGAAKSALGDSAEASIWINDRDYFGPNTIYYDGAKLVNYKNEVYGNYRDAVVDQSATSASYSPSLNYQGIKLYGLAKNAYGDYSGIKAYMRSLNKFPYKSTWSNKVSASKYYDSTLAQHSFTGTSYNIIAYSEACNGGRTVYDGWDSYISRPGYTWTHSIGQKATTSGSSLRAINSHLV
jgi:hypothetical protein